MAEPSAYTLGNQASYDRALAEATEPILKLGHHPEDGYEGGIVFASLAEALAWLDRHPEFPHRGVYGLALPHGWDEDVRQEMLPGEEHHRLKSDAEILILGASCAVSDHDSSLRSEGSTP